MNGVIYAHKDAKEMIVCYSYVSIHMVCVCMYIYIFHANFSFKGPFLV